MASQFDDINAKALIRRVQRYEEHIAELESTNLSCSGYENLGYYKGRKSAFEEILDEISPGWDDKPKFAVDKAFSDDCAKVASWFEWNKHKTDAIRDGKEARIAACGAAAQCQLFLDETPNKKFAKHIKAAQELEYKVYGESPCLREYAPDERLLHHIKRELDNVAAWFMIHEDESSSITNVKRISKIAHDLFQTIAKQMQPS